MNTTDRLTYRDSRDAFADAIAKGILSTDRDSSSYAGIYRYMGTRRGVDRFRNLETRRDVAVQP